MMRFRNIVMSLMLASAFLFGFTQPSLAAPDLGKQITGQVTAGAQGGGLGAPKSPQESLASLVQIFLGFLATFFLVLVILSGYWLVTARGNEQKHEKAMSTIRRATIGFIVVIMAYGISLFVGRLIKSSVNVDEQNLRNCGLFQRVFDRPNCPE